MKHSQNRCFSFFVASSFPLYGGEALTICQNHEGPIDLLVTDVVMPFLGDRELADRIVLIHPKIKVLSVSGYTDDAVVPNGIYADRVQFLHEPCVPVALADKVREVLDQKANSRLAPLTGPCLNAMSGASQTRRD
jgi:CheY-like chemotaxis protein